jgi:hypothetical protein
MRFIIIVSVLWLAGSMAAVAAELDGWDRAYDPATRTRFIPLQLIIGGEWNGERTITYPVGTFGELIDHGSIWVGPRKWTHPRTGEELIARPALCRVRPTSFGRRDGPDRRRTKPSPWVLP